MRAHGGRLKHLDVSAFDREIVQRVADRHALGKVKLLHPSAMYGLFNAYWRQMAPVTLVDAFTSFSGLRPPLRPDIAARLPARYVAAKFYANGALPDTPENRAFVARTLAELTRTHDVVLLNTRVRFDDHGEFTAGVRDRIHSIDHLMRAEDNLEVQSAVIGGAEAFVGTYGGFSYLAPLLGVNTVAFYSHPAGFRFDHLDVARRVFSSLRLGAFVPLDVREIDVVRLGIGGDVESLGCAGGPSVMTITSSLARALPPPAHRLAAAAWSRWTGAFVQRELASLARSGRPLIVGPWLGEVGFELLYWIPFLDWAVERFRSTARSCWSCHAAARRRGIATFRQDIVTCSSSSAKTSSASVTASARVTWGSRSRCDPPRSSSTSPAQSPGRKGWTRPRCCTRR